MSSNSENFPLAIRGSAPPLPGADASSMLRALKRRWAFALLAGVLGAALASALTWSLYPASKYTARSLIRVATAPPKIVFETHDPGTNYFTYQKTQITLVKSRLVLNAAIRDPSVASLESIRRQADPVEWLEKTLMVDFPGGSEILQVSLSGDLPDDLAKLVNAVTNSYMTNIVNREATERIERHAGLKKIYERYQSGLEERRRALKSLAESLGSSDKQTLAFKQQLSMDHLAQTRTELLQVQSELRKSLVELGAMESSTDQAGEITEGMIQQATEAHPAVTELAGRLAAARQRLENVMRIDRSQIDPATTAARRAYDSLALALDRKRKEVRPAVEAGLQKVDESRQEFNRLARRVNVLRSQDSSLNQELTRLSGEISSFGKESLDLQSHQDQMEINAETARRVGALVEAIEVEFQAPPRISILDQAAPPKTKDEMKKIRMTAMSSLGAFAMLALGVGFWESRLRRIQAVEEVVRTLGITVIGTLPKVPRWATRSGRSAVARRRMVEASMIESINAARTVLIHSTRADSLRVVMITSALKGEGKTSLSGHLAVSLASVGLRTLLVDCDLRSPSIHRLFDLAPSPGVAEMLRGEINPTDAVQATIQDGPWVITAGSSDERTCRLLAMGGLNEAFRGLRNDFDYIIVDSAPILAVADSLLVAEQVDAVLFSILRDVSRIPEVYAAYERLEKLGIRMLGAVVSGDEKLQAGYYS